ncbi:MAG TPA: MBL fold metallo-hydrolase [Polyangiales bacterium]|nr:MBL fold metallo-hydrolase [Polyangiales bacterium]
MARRFSNLDGTAEVADLVDILRWQLGFHDEKRPRAPATGVDVPTVANDGQALRHATKDALTWIGHASFLIQLGGRSALVDPVLSDRLSAVVRRNVAPGLDWPALPKIDVVLVTHNHRDHMDGPTLKRLGSDPVYVVPRGLGDWFERAGLRRVVEMDWWQEEEIEGLRVTFVPSQHWSRRGLTDMNASWWGGYVLERGGLRVYHSGDTAWFDGFSLIGKRCGDIHAAMLPIGAYAPRWFMRPQHMDPADAVRAFEALGASKLVAMHWGTFKLTDEHLAEPPELLREIWARSGLPDARRLVPAIGETLRLDR